MSSPSLNIQALQAATIAKIQVTPSHRQIEGVDAAWWREHPRGKYIEAVTDDVLFSAGSTYKYALNHTDFTFVFGHTPEEACALFGGASPTPLFAHLSVSGDSDNPDSTNPTNVTGPASIYRRPNPATQVVGGKTGVIPGPSTGEGRVDVAPSAASRALVVVNRTDPSLTEQQPRAGGPSGSVAGPTEPVSAKTDQSGVPPKDLLAGDRGAVVEGSDEKGSATPATATRKQPANPDAGSVPNGASVSIAGFGGKGTAEDPLDEDAKPAASSAEPNGGRPEVERPKGHGNPTAGSNTRAQEEVGSNAAFDRVKAILSRGCARGPPVPKPDGGMASVSTRESSRPSVPVATVDAKGSRDCADPIAKDGVTDPASPTKQTPVTPNPSRTGTEPCAKDTDASKSSKVGTEVPRRSDGVASLRTDGSSKVSEARVKKSNKWFEENRDSKLCRVPVPDGIVWPEELPDPGKMWTEGTHATDIHGTDYFFLNSTYGFVSPEFFFVFRGCRAPQQSEYHVRGKRKLYHKTGQEAKLVWDSDWPHELNDQEFFDQIKSEYTEPVNPSTPGGVAVSCKYEIWGFLALFVSSSHFSIVSLIRLAGGPFLCFTSWSRFCAKE